MRKSQRIVFCAAALVAFALAGCLPPAEVGPGPSPFPGTAAPSPAAARKLLLIEFFGIA